MTMGKIYNLSDITRIKRLRHESTAREKENRIIKEIQEKNKQLNSRPYHMASKDRKKQMRAESNTIPLEAFGFST